MGGGVFTGSRGEQTGDGEADEWRWAGGGVMCRVEMVGYRRSLDVLEHKKNKQKNRTRLNTREFIMKQERGGKKHREAGVPHWENQQSGKAWWEKSRFYAASRWVNGQQMCGLGGLMRWSAAGVEEPEPGLETTGAQTYIRMHIHKYRLDSMTHVESCVHNISCILNKICVKVHHLSWIIALILIFGFF